MSLDAAAPHLPILAGLEASGIRLGLAPLGALLASLGNPQHAVPAVLVAGTNGKGSTAALLQAMAVAAGYRTGFYSSPHLEDPVERVRIDGRAITAGELADRLRQVLGAAGRLGHPLPTYFEAMTAAAFLSFAAHRLDLAVLEVGMGGRLDATNLAEPLLSVITSISLDHQEFLGRTVGRISREKGGILRSGRPALAAPGDRRAARVLTLLAKSRGVPLSLLEDESGGAWECPSQHGEAEDGHVAANSPGPRGVAVATPTRRYRDLRLALAGTHQLTNLRLAVRAAEELERLGFARLDAAAIARGVARCRWPGRLEWVGLPQGRSALLDAAHNAGGARMLASALAAQTPELRSVLLCGLLVDKDAAAMLPPLVQAASSVVLTRPGSPRARPPAELAALLGTLTGLEANRPEVLVEEHPERALALALGRPERQLVVAGSIVLVGEVRRLLRERFGVPEAAATLALA